MKLLDFDIEAKHIKPSKNRGLSLIKESMSVPISPISTDWSRLDSPERLAKTFIFNDFRKMYDFISDLLVHQEKIGHHAKIIIDHRSVSVETFTKDVNAVTELDIDLVKYCDTLYEDVSYYYAADNVDDNKFQ